MFRALLFVIFASFAPLASGGEVSKARDATTGWDVYTLKQDDTIVRVVPAAGANAFSVVHQGVEYFRVPRQLAQLPGVGYGNPILYPTPNRIKGATFSFAGRRFEFPKNGRGNFIHGLVHSEAFAVDGYQSSAESAEIACSLTFSPGNRTYELFPLEHTFRITISVESGAVRWTYEVDNRSGKGAIPFGVGFHPYVIYQNSRKQSYLQVPATHHMQAEEQLPSGILTELAGHPLDAREPTSLENYRSDDVFFGMQPDRPAMVEFRKANHRITFNASKEFTHLVVWTPDRPYFGIENQTCSTDAHNLASQGKEKVAHLQICLPGMTMTGSVQYRFE